MTEGNRVVPLPDRIIASLVRHTGERKITVNQFLEGAGCSIMELFDLHRKNPTFLDGVLNTFGLTVVSEVQEESDALVDYREREKDRTPKSLRAVSLSEWERDPQDFGGHRPDEIPQ